LIRHLLLFLMAAVLFLVSCRSSGLAPKRPDLAERQSLEKKLGVQLPAGYNPQLISTLSKWKGSPYKYGGETTSGVDCSGMVKSVYGEVFGMKLEHNAARQKELSRQINENQLRQGDLVFFRINAKKTDHVGIYLWEGYFMHASTKKGVTINHLSEPYYRKAFDGAGTYLH
jgi:probable lipoprotein NlpC